MDYYRLIKAVESGRRVDELRGGYGDGYGGLFYAILTNRGRKIELTYSHFLCFFLIFPFSDPFTSFHQDICVAIHEDFIGRRIGQHHDFIWFVVDSLNDDSSIWRFVDLLHVNDVSTNHLCDSTVRRKSISDQMSELL